MFETLLKPAHWLAKCKSRLYRPIDVADRSGLTAFEYGWKAFNNLYSDFSGQRDRDKMYSCLGTFVDFEDYFARNHRALLAFCEIEHRTYLVDPDYGDLNSRLSPMVHELRLALNEKQISKVPLRTVDCLYVIRNARVHGGMVSGKVYFSALPKTILEIGVSIISGKIGEEPNRVHMQIDQLMNNEVNGFEPTQK